MNQMRKLMETVGNTYADAASKHVDGLAKVIADYLTTVTDDPYVFSDISEFSGGALEVRVTELLQDAGIGIEEDINRTYDTYSEEDLKQAYMVGWQDGVRAGEIPTGMLGPDETPEEAYEYWNKYDRGDT